MALKKWNTNFRLEHSVLKNRTTGQPGKTVCLSEDYTYMHILHQGHTGSSARVTRQNWILPLYEEEKTQHTRFPFDMTNVYCTLFNQDEPCEDSKRSMVRPKTKSFKGAVSRLSSSFCL